MKKNTAFIFARGGSKGVKDKNIRIIGGKPLIAHAIAAALGSAHINKVIVSTDSEKIGEVARQYGAGVLKRPAELAADDTPEILAWRHAVENAQPKDQPLFIALSATTPLRASQDVDAAIASFQKTKCDAVFGITPAGTHPSFTMVTIGEDNLVHICMPGSTATRRQEIPPVYDIIGSVYVTTPDYVMNCPRLIDGNVGYFEIPAERSIDIDTEYDFYLADLILNNPFKKDKI